MAREVPKQSLSHRNPGKLATAGSNSCWWTETGWLCCTTETPWPACFPGGVSTPGGGGSNNTGAPGVARANRRVSMTRIGNPSMIPVAPAPNSPPPGANQYVVAPHGATPGATAWLYTVGVAMPTMVRITAIYNNPSGVFVDVTPTYAPTVAEMFGPSLTGGFGEVLAPFSQGGSVRTTAGSPVRTANPYQDVQGSLARAGRATRSSQLGGQMQPQFKKPTAHGDPGSSALPTGWLTATYFPGPPYNNARRWIKIVSPHPQAPALFHAPGQPQQYAFYNAILFTQWGAQQQQLVAETRHTGSGTFEARILPQFSWDTSDPGPGSWPGGPDIPPSPNTVPTETMSFSMRPVRNPVPRQSLTRRNPSPPSSGDCAVMVDVQGLRLHCPGSPLHGVEVTDIESDHGDLLEGSLIAVSYVDPTTGAEVVAEFPVAPDQGVAWWEHDGHCCESCALGEGCSDCEDAA